MFVLLLTAGAGAYYVGAGGVAERPAFVAVPDLLVAPLSVAAACVALAKERPSGYAIVALILSVLSLLCALSF